MGVDFWKMGVSFSENGSYCFRKWELIFLKWELVFSKMGVGNEVGMCRSRIYAVLRHKHGVYDGCRAREVVQRDRHCCDCFYFIYCIQKRHT